MGKYKHEHHTHNYNPHLGCVWSIFLQALKYHHWHNVKKRLPHRRHGAGGNKQAKGDENLANKQPFTVGNQQETSFQEVNNSKVKQKVREGSPAKKSSVRARIKARITNGMSKRKGRHRRNPTDSVHRLEPSDEDLLTEIILGDENPTIASENNESSDSTSSMDTPSPKSFQENNTNEEICEDNEVGKEKQLIENLMLLQKNLEDKELALLEQKLTGSEEEVTPDASLHRSKEFLEALDIINSNKEFFLEVLHDPRSIVAHNIHNQIRQPLHVKTGYTKSESFALPASSSRRDLGLGTSKLKHKQDVIGLPEQVEEKLQNGDQAQNSIGHESIEDDCKQTLPSIIHENWADGVQKPNQAMADITDCSSSSSSQQPKNHVRNEAVIKRFKDLKQKIKHAFKETKNEKHRITMDAVLHKIPRPQGFPGDLKKKILDQFKDPFIKSHGENNHAALIGKTRHNRFTRQLSHSDSLDRYCHLYESRFRAEPKPHTSDRLKLRKEDAALPPKTTPKSLGRILSLPELKSYYYQSEDLYGFSPRMMPVRTPVEKNVSISGLDEQGSNVPIASDTPVESHTEKFSKGSETESVSKLVDESAPDNEQDIEHVTIKLVEPSPVSELDSNFEEVTETTAESMLHEDSKVQRGHIHSGEQDSLTSHQHESIMDTPIVARGRDLNKVEFPSNRESTDILQAHIDTKHKAKFDYVRNILELSGFSGNECLGAWYSDGQPVDPSVYEEVEGDILLDTDCSGNEGSYCDLMMMLLFDLINEVLMEIFEKSYSYYPTTLSSLTRIHPMPAGYRVLKEVWLNISWYLRLTPEVDQSLDYVVGADLAKGDEWMNLQFDSECVALEVEEFIFDDLLEEVILCT